MAGKNQICILNLSAKTNLAETSIIVSSVTRSGNFLDFGQLFKAFGNN